MGLVVCRLKCHKTSRDLIGHLDDVIRPAKGYAKLFAPEKRMSKFVVRNVSVDGPGSQLTNLS